MEKEQKEVIFSPGQVAMLFGGSFPYAGGFAWERVEYFKLLEHGVLQPYSGDEILPGPSIVLGISISAMSGACSLSDTGILDKLETMIADSPSQIMPVSFLQNEDGIALTCGKVDDWTGTRCPTAREAIIHYVR